MKKISRTIAIIMVMGLLAVSIPSPVAAIPAQGGLVTLTFDHQYESTYQNAFPLLSQYGYQGVIYCISGLTQFDSSPFMSIAELADMRDAGWEIGTHTVSHPYLTSLSLAEAEAEISECEQWVIDNGLSDDVISFAYPHGDTNGPVTDIAERYYLYARTTVEDISDYGRSARLNGVLLWGDDEDNSLDFVMEKITEAIEQNKWAIIYTHGVTYDQDDWRLNPYNGDVSANVLRELLDFIQSTGVPVETFAQIEAGEGNPPNHHPVANPDSYTMSQNDIITVAAPGVLGNDTDADGDALTASVADNPSHGTLTFSAEGSFTYIPDAGFSGDDNFAYLAYDGELSSASVVVTITVNASGGGTGTGGTFGLNDGSSSWYEGSGALDVQRFGNTAGSGILTKIELLLDTSSPRGKARLGVYADDNNAPGGLLLDAGEVDITGGWIEINGLSLPVTQTYYWLGFVMDSANIIRLENGPAMSHYWYNTGYRSLPNDPGPYFRGYNAAQYVMRATVTVDGEPPPPSNNPPTATVDIYSVNENSILNVAAPGVLENDTDIDSDPLTVALVGGVSHGTLAFNADGSFTYTPVADYHGIDSFTYKANDGQADSNTVTVGITVTVVNDAPVARDDTYSTTQDTVLNISAPGVLENDTDIDGDAPTAALVTGVSHGTLALNADGSFTYAPAVAYNGLDSFTYMVNDGQVDSNTAMVSITISAATTTFGLNSGDNNWHEGADMIDVMRFRNTAGDGIIAKLEILFDDTTPRGKVRLGVYADNNGAPDDLLLNAGEAVVTNGWVSISGLSLAVTQDTYYWLAFSLERDNIVRTRSGQPVDSHYWTNRAYGSFPSPYPGTNYNGGQFVMRATVNR